MVDPHRSTVRIQLLREMAAGPMSAVFVGEQRTRSGPRRVAIKLLRQLPDGGVDRLLDLRDRARRLRELDHRHHAPTFDVARVDERFALISPYIDGIDLLDWMDVMVETGKMLPRRVSCEILRGTSSALDAALRWSLPSSGQPCGMVHRDLKPSNLIITRDGSLRITDFGTGFTSLAGRAARAGALKKGLVRYLAPERREGHRASERSDIYALGVLAIELFRGRWLRRLRTKNPAHDRQLADVIARIDDLQMRSESDDRALRNLLLRMVAFDEEARPDFPEVVSTFRTLGDRIDGPSLEAFAEAHAVPWLEEAPQAPDERLLDAVAVVVERGQPLPPAGGGLPLITLPDRYDVQLEQSGQDTGEFLADEHTDPLRRRPSGASPSDQAVDPTEPIQRLTTLEVMQQLAAEQAEEPYDDTLAPIDEDIPPVREPAGLLESEPRRKSASSAEARLQSLPAPPRASTIEEVFVDPVLGESSSAAEVVVEFEDDSIEVMVEDLPTQDTPLPPPAAAWSEPLERVAHRETTDSIELDEAPERSFMLPAILLGGLALITLLSALGLILVLVLIYAN